jgi:hypothetical protein
MVLTLWIMGDIILGIVTLLTRGDKVIVEETIGDGPSRSSSRFGKEPDDSWALSIDQKIAQAVQETRQRSSTVGPVSSADANGWVWQAAAGQLDFGAH